MSPRPDILVVGAGFAGATIARVCADAGRNVVIIDQRGHIGGNAFDEQDRDGILVHRYGPHIFHTNSPEVVCFLSRFTNWHPYEHRVLANHHGELYPIPINRTTLERFFHTSLPDAAAAETLLAHLRVSNESVRNSEDALLRSVGRELYNAFFAGYTRKQWGRDASELDPSVAARIPVRSDTDDRYFTDRHQAMPTEGYSPLFLRLLDHPRIHIELNIPYEKKYHRHLARHLVFTGPIDSFFEFQLGHLPYRSIRFAFEHHCGGLIQPVATVNHPDPDVAFTRVTEFRHITGQNAMGTTLVREFPQADGDPYYPIPAPETRDLARRYSELAETEDDVTFVGRLAQYRYFNMDQVVAAALVQAKRILGTTQ